MYGTPNGITVWCFPVYFFDFLNKLNFAFLVVSRGGIEVLGAGELICNLWWHSILVNQQRDWPIGYGVRNKRKPREISRWGYLWIIWDYGIMMRISLWGYLYGDISMGISRWGFYVLFFQENMVSLCDGVGALCSTMEDGMVDLWRAVTTSDTDSIFWCESNT